MEVLLIQIFYKINYMCVQCRMARQQTSVFCIKWNSISIDKKNSIHFHSDKLNETPLINEKCLPNVRIVRKM